MRLVTRQYLSPKKSLLYTVSLFILLKWGGGSRISELVLGNFFETSAFLSAVSLWNVISITS